MRLSETTNWRIERVAHDHMDMVCAFSCSDGFDTDRLEEYLCHDALHDTSTVLYIVYDASVERAISMFALSCSAIMHTDNILVFLNPAVEITAFALDNQYQHVIFEDAQNLTIGDVIFHSILDIIATFTADYCGADYILLHANNASSRRFYSRNGFCDFHPYMRMEDNNFVQNCFPMYCDMRPEPEEPPQ